jgi:hypothetical protein
VAPASSGAGSSLADDDALSDPLSNRTFDFGYEAEVAARVHNRPFRKDA